MMLLNEQLKQDHKSGDFGGALEGYAERANAGLDGTGHNSGDGGGGGFTDIGARGGVACKKTKLDHTLDAARIAWGRA